MWICFKWTPILNPGIFWDKKIIRSYKVIVPGDLPLCSVTLHNATAPRDFSVETDMNLYVYIRIMKIVPIRKTPASGPLRGTAGTGFWIVIDPPLGCTVLGQRHPSHMNNKKVPSPHHSWILRFSEEIPTYGQDCNEVNFHRAYKIMLSARQECAIKRILVWPSA